MKTTSMKTVTTEYAAEHLDELLDLVTTGEPVLLSMNGRSIARLVRVEEDDATEVPLSEVEEAFHGD
jgi:antitoxin (DNA-binding transcriptional repressor) of toxin-antitoxin stability system